MLETILIARVEPVGEKLLHGGGLYDSAREDMSTDLASLLQQEDSEVFLAIVVGQLLQTNGSTQPGRPYTR